MLRMDNHIDWCRFPHTLSPQILGLVSTLCCNPYNKGIPVYSPTHSGYTLGGIFYEKTCFRLFLALCLSFGFLSTDCGLFTVAHATTSGLCVCGSAGHHDMLGHTSPNFAEWDPSIRKGKRTEYNPDTGKYEEKEYVYSSYISSFEELNIAYELSKAEAEAKNNSSLIIDTFIMAKDFVVTKPWIVPEGSNITVITQGYNIKVDLTDLQHWYQHYYSAIIAADSCKVTLNSGLGNDATKISSVTHPPRRHYQQN